MSSSPLSIRSHFLSLRDPRRQHRQRHRLLDIVVIALCAVIADADTWQEVEAFGRERRDWLAGFLDLPDGTPSHDTFERLFDRLDPVGPPTLPAGLDRVRQRRAEGRPRRHRRQDAAPLRQSRTRPGGVAPRQRLGDRARPVAGPGRRRGQVQRDHGDPATCWNCWTVKGALVTIDAMGCQKEIAKKIVEGGRRLHPAREREPGALAGRHRGGGNRCAIEDGA